MLWPYLGMSRHWPNKIDAIETKRRDKLLIRLALSLACVSQLMKRLLLLC